MGPPEVSVNGRALPRLRTKKGVYLLALLALRKGREVDRTWLASTLWPDSTEAQALSSLRRTLTDLRTALGNQEYRLRSPSPTTLALDVEGAWIDVLEFEKQKGEPEAAVTLIRGPFLEGCSEEWVFAERERLHQDALSLLESLAERRESEDKPAEAASLYYRLLALDPIRESALRGALRSEGKRGDYAAALRAYRQFRERLHYELNLEPSAETKALMRSLRDSSQVPALAGETVTPRNSVGPALPQNHFPRPLTALIGRDEDLLALDERLQEARLVTLVGMGGMGKTRLCLAVADRIGDRFEDGAAFVDLAGAATDANVLSTLAESLGLSGQTGETSLNTVCRELSGRNLLLLLDNCEHVILGTAEAAKAILSAAPKLRILATSRQALGVPGEELWRVESMPCPDDDDIPALVESPAIQLFVDRARASAPNFSPDDDDIRTIAEICRRLDSSPLAIELAASRVRLFTVQQLLARLKDRFQILKGADRTNAPRQQTLYDLIDWSYRLLNPAEQSLLRRLTAFAGAFELEAAEAVCAESDADDADILDNFSQLVEKSLVSPSLDGKVMTYRLLESTREFAKGQLATKEEGEMAQRLVAYLIERGEAAKPTLHGPHLADALRFFELHHDDIRAALAWSIASRDSETAGRLLIVADSFWDLRGFFAESCRWFKQVEPLFTAPNATSIELGIRLTWAQLGAGNFEEARKEAESCLGQAAMLEDPALMSRARNNLAKILDATGEYEAALPLYEENLRFAEERGDEKARHIAYHNLGLVCQNLKQFDRAVDCTQRCLEHANKIDDVPWQAWAMGNLGEIYRDMGRLDEARQLLVQSTEIMRLIGNRPGIVSNLVSLGAIEAAKLPQGSAQRAASLLAAFSGLRHRLGFAYRSQEQAIFEAAMPKIRECLTESEFLSAWNAGHNLDLEDAVEFVLADDADSPLLRIIHGSA